MPRFGKPDNTGRSSGRCSGREKKLRGPPKGESWAWLTRELLASPARQALGINARKLIDFLLIEHCNHAGRENGNLCATHEQLREYGLTGDEIRPAIEEARFLGFLRFKRGGRWNGSNQPSRYRLTFYADRDGNPPTNEWKKVTDDDIAQGKAERKVSQSASKACRKKTKNCSANTEYGTP